MTSAPRRLWLRQLGSLGLATVPLTGILTACANSPRTTAPPSLTTYHLLNRLSWGANDMDMDRIHALGNQHWLAQQLRGNLHDELPPAIQASIDALTIQQRTLVDIAVDLRAKKQKGESLLTEDERKKNQQELHEEMNRLAHEASTRHLLRAMYSPAQLQERLTWFWFNHFNVFQHKHHIRAMLGDYEERALRPHVLGSFRTLLGAALHHPAMLAYLDNEQNAAGKLNENLARELMELHTLGVDAGYTQRDVQELARILTGHGLRVNDESPRLNKKWADLSVQDGLYSFQPRRHDFGDKTLLGRPIKGSGAGELDEALDLLATHPATAHFISRKLARAFCCDQPSLDLVSTMAAAFQRSDGHIGSTLDAMIHHTEFSQTTGQHFKDPVHYVIAAIRAAYNDQIIANTRPMENWIQRLGEGLYNRQTPDGYALTADAWSSSGQMATRFDIARTIGSSAAGLFKAESINNGIDRPGFPQLASPIYYQHIQPIMGPDTRKALDQANTPQEWNTLYLSAPEFMYT